MDAIVTNRPTSRLSELACELDRIEELGNAVGCRGVIEHIHGAKRADILDRRVVICGYRTPFAYEFAAWAKQNLNLVAVIDDTRVGDDAEGLTILGSRDLERIAETHGDLIGVDITFSAAANRHFGNLFASVGVKIVDYAVAMHLCEAPTGLDYYKQLVATTFDTIDALRQFAETLGDEDSRVHFLSVALYRLTLDRKWLQALSPDYETRYFGHGTFGVGRDDVFVDGGAYDGDSIDLLIDTVGGRIRHVYAFEPDPMSFSTLERNYGRRSWIDLHSAGLWDKAGELPFENGGSEMSRVADSSSHRISVVALDDIVEAPTLIKLDVEGSEPEALRGANRVIERYRPRLALSIYHHPDHFLAIPALVKEMRSDYVFDIRHHGNHLFDTVLYAH